MSTLAPKQLRPEAALPRANAARARRADDPAHAAPDAASAAPRKAPARCDLSRIAVRDKTIETVGNGIEVEDQQPKPGPPKPGAGAPAPAPPKPAGVDSFVVKWTKNPAAGPTVAKFFIEYDAKFTNDAAHDPAQAEFRQNAFHKLAISAGPHAGTKDDNSPLHDDNYSRADDTAGNSATSDKFHSNDNPGVAKLDANDVIDYTFTAEQMIINKSDGKELAKRGPHTVTIAGKEPRTYVGAPKTFS